MKPNMILKLVTDVAMTVALLLLMSYGMIGEAAHEWIGAGIFVLFVLHHILNRRWSGSLLRGKYTLARIAQTLLVLLLLMAMISSMISGIILSRYVIPSSFIRGGRALARNLHMLSAYWGFVLMALHLGFHWNMMMALAQRGAGKPSPLCVMILRILSVLFACYGMYAFITRHVWRYMLMLDHFVFFDYEEPLFLFLMDYLAIMGLFVFTGHYLFRALRSRNLQHIREW